MVKKNDMRDRIGQAASSAPSLTDRFQHARDSIPQHPSEVDLHANRRTAELAIGHIQATAGDLEGRDATPAESVTDPKKAYHRTISLDLIDPNPYNARHIYRQTRINELKASIGAHGQETPGIATLRSGRYVLAAGHYRFRVLKLLGVKTMELMIREGLTNRELYEISYRENAERDGQSSLDDAMSWKQLITDGIYANETEVADATGKSLSLVNKTMAALKLSPAVLEIVQEHPNEFNLSVLYELSIFEPIAGVQRTVSIANEVLLGDIGRKQIQEARALLEHPKTRKRKEQSRQYKLQSAGQEIGSLKEWDSGKVMFEILLEDPEERAKLVDELKTRYAANVS